ncbi:MAG: UbiD family decarboxylase, partial [Acidobacteria bacterium]|nr:UbiD family decarboxylase [Acidobacteriota bacterium]
MAYRNLRDFIRKLDKAGELKRIKAEVDVDLEITEITDRVSKSVGPALLFERPRGYDIPVAINLLGSPSRMNLALETDSPDRIAQRLEELLDTKTPSGLFDKVKMLPKLAELGSFLPKT